MRRITYKLIILTLIILSISIADVYAYDTLRYGDSGDAVRQLQEKLISLGFDTKGADGKYGNGTKKAVYAFQRAKGLYKDGIAGNKTQEAIYNTSSGTKADTTAAAVNVNLPNTINLPPNTLEYGAVSDYVKDMQLALNSLGYKTNGTDGRFGEGTKKAVKSFQKKHKLTADGKAGNSTLKLLYQLCGVNTSGNVASNTATPTPANPAATNNPPAAVPNISAYNVVGTLQRGSTGNEVALLKQALKQLGYYKGNVDSNFNDETVQAIKNLQKQYAYEVDGVAGAMTQRAIQKLIAGEKLNVNTSNEKPLALDFAPPTTEQVQLLHWYNDVRPNVRTGTKLNVYDPETGAGWKLRAFAGGKHLDAEPLTAKDTEELFKAFGGIETWTPNNVYVQLPDGRWSLATTHNVAHDGSTIKDNNFNGHLCVHFLRNLDETQEVDPKYGMTNQTLIRKVWKKMTGIDYQDQ